MKLKKLFIIAFIGCFTFNYNANSIDVEDVDLDQIETVISTLVVQPAEEEKERRDNASSVKRKKIKARSEFNLGTDSVLWEKDGEGINEFDAIEIDEYDDKNYNSIEDEEYDNEYYEDYGEEENSDWD